jgi:glutamate/tyrosine decarboxylase-like PLP-dependent enzyme
MEKEFVKLREETLDPEHWQEIRDLGHKMVDDMMDYLRDVRQRPVWQRPPGSAKEALQQPVPLLPSSQEQVYTEFVENVLPYNTNNIHPRFWSWVQGGGTAFGMLADMLASGMNSNVSIGDHMPMYVDQQVIEWSKQLIGFPETSTGLLTSGASIANITALIVARNNFDESIKAKGLRAVNGQLVMYGSVETHHCVFKAAETIGIGSENFRKVPVDKSYRIRIDELERLIEEDRKAGNIPFCVVGNAGTVNTGAIDPLEQLVGIAKREKLWLHVDGAFGAIPKILPEWQEQLQGIESADSLSFDFHKWMYVNYEVACVLIRNGKAHREAFATKVNYLVSHEKGLSGGPDAFANYGMELSRGFKALKVWMLIKEHGIEKYQRLIRQNLEQAQYLAKLVTINKQLELVAPVTLNIVCFRFNPGGLNTDELNHLNKHILMELQEQGIAAPSYTLLHGQYALRVANTNHRSKRKDFDILIKEVERIGNELLKINGYEKRVW